MTLPPGRRRVHPVGGRITSPSAGQWGKGARPAREPGDASHDPSVDLVPVHRPRPGFGAPAALRRVSERKAGGLRRGVVRSLGERRCDAAGWRLWRWRSISGTARRGAGGCLCTRRRKNASPLHRGLGSVGGLSWPRGWCGVRVVAPAGGRGSWTVSSWAASSCRGRAGISDTRMARHRMGRSTWSAIRERPGTWVVGEVSRA